MKSNEQVSARAGLVDVEALETQIKEMYSAVADQPEGDFHFETGHRLAERLGYPAQMLDSLPVEAVSRLREWATSSTWRG